LVETLCYKPEVAGSITDEAIQFNNSPIFQQHYGPWVDSSSNRNQYQGPSWGKGRQARNDDNLTDTREPIV
jgi:aryl-phospho-beta-D-glucosidase BglC (GH1 family)